MYGKIQELLGDQAQSLLTHTCKTVSKEQLHLPGPDFLDRVFAQTDRKATVMRNLATMFRTGRLAGTGYLSLLPVDQGIEHSAGASFAPNPVFFDPKNICELAIEGGCNGVATTLGVLGSVARRYAHKIPFIMKFNHNELLTYPNVFDQVVFGSIEQAFDMGCVGVGATVAVARERLTRGARGADGLAPVAIGAIRLTFGRAARHDLSRGWINNLAGEPAIHGQ
jgi:class I fructose-bisphosphate aldolase